MKGNASYKDNTVTFVQWNGSNLDEVKEFVVGERVFLATDGSEELYITNLGIVRKMYYICKDNNYAYKPFVVYSWKVFPRIINEDIGSGLSI